MNRIIPPPPANSNVSPLYIRVFLASSVFITFNPITYFSSLLFFDILFFFIKINFDVFHIKRRKRMTDRSGVRDHHRLGCRENNSRKMKITNRFSTSVKLKNFIIFRIAEFCIANAVGNVKICLYAGRIQEKKNWEKCLTHHHHHP